MKLNFEEHANADGFNSKFFNSKSTPKDLAETVLPKANADKLKKNANAFDQFSKTSRKI